MKTKIISALLLIVFILGQSTPSLAAILTDPSEPSDAEINLDDSDELLEDAMLAFAELEELEQQVRANKELTLDDIDANRYHLDYTNYEAKFAGIAGISEAPLGIPSFLWGFCLGWVGILVVFLVKDDEPDQKEETKKAVIGCAVGTALGTILYFAIFAAAATTY